MSLIKLFKTIPLFICISCFANYRVVVGDFLITERGTVIPTAKKLSKLYQPKFFPKDYRIHFESKKAYDDFVKSSSIIKEKRGIGCHEYVLYRGEVVVHRIFRRFEQCSDNKVLDNFSCAQLKNLNEINSDLELSYDKRMVSNCLASLIHTGETINNQTNQYDCNHKPLDLKTLPYPDTKDNSGKREFFFVMDSGLMVTIAKELFERDYFKREGTFYFETKRSFLDFKQNAKKEYIFEKGFIRHCYKTTTYNGQVIKESVDRKLCY